MLYYGVAFHRKVWVERDPEDHLVPNPLPWTGRLCTNLAVLPSLLLLLACHLVLFYIICDISLSFIYCSEALICSAFSSGFLQLHLIYTVSLVL